MAVKRYSRKVVEEFLDDYDCVFIKSYGYFEVWKTPRDLIFMVSTIGEDKLADAVQFDDIVELVQKNTPKSKPSN